MLLHEFLFRAVQVYPEKIAFVSGEQRRTYADLFEESCRLANSLIALGVGRGTRISILLPNSPLYFTVYHAGSLTGATIVPINPRLTAREIQHVLDDSLADILIYDPGFDEELNRLEFRSGIRLIAVRHSSRAGVDYYEDLIARASPSVPTNEVLDEDIALQLYTSGTTGKPKGAMLSHRALYLNALTSNGGQGLSPADVFLSVTPLGHAAAGTRLFNVVCAGATHVTLDRFSAGDVLDTIRREGITNTMLVPTLIRTLMDDPDFDRADLRSLRLLVYGAAPAPVPLIEEALQRVPCDLMQAYGLTEGCPYLTRLLPADHAVGSPVLSSIGQPAECVQTRMVGENGEDIAPGEVGELIVRSPKAMSGYWNRPEDTAKVLQDGWLRTGDVGRMEDGYIYLTGRKSDMIVSGGFNVYPQEIEDVIVSIPGVRETAVVGIAHERWGETPVAYIVFEDGSGLGAEDVLRYCKKSLAGYKIPTQIKTIDRLPRNSTGKVIRSELLSSEGS